MSNTLSQVITFVMATSFNIYSLNAQLTSIEIGASVGTFVYQGDLTPSRFGSFRTQRPGIGIHVAKILNSSMTARINLAIGSLRGNDASYDKPEFRQQRNFNFSSSLVELSGLITWNPLKRNYADKGLSPYLFGGAGVSYLNIRRDWSNFNPAYFGETSDLPDRIAVDANHSTPSFIPVIPVGAGIRYGLTPRIALTAEASYRFVFTDYLDGFSVAANPKQNDHYHTINVGAVYRLGKKNKLDCPVVRP